MKDRQTDRGTESQRESPHFHSNPAKEAFNQRRLSKSGFIPFSTPSVNNHKNKEGPLSGTAYKKEFHLGSNANTLTVNIQL